MSGARRFSPKVLADAREIRMTITPEEVRLRAFGAGQEIRIVSAAGESDKVLDETFRIIASAYVLSLHASLGEKETADLLGKLFAVGDAARPVVYEVLSGLHLRGLRIGSPLALHRVMKDPGRLWELAGDAGLAQRLMRMREAIFNQETPVTRCMMYRDTEGSAGSIQLYFRRTFVPPWDKSVDIALDTRKDRLKSTMDFERGGDRMVFSGQLAQVLSAAMQDGFGVIFAGPTGVGKTTMQMAYFRWMISSPLAAELIGNRPFVIVDAYHELEVFREDLRGSALRADADNSLYYCIQDSSFPFHAADLARFVTSANIGVMVVQEANMIAQNDDQFASQALQALLRQLFTSGVPFLLTAFAVVPLVILDDQAIEIGFHILRDLNQRVFQGQSAFDRVIVGVLPAFQFYAVVGGNVFPMLKSTGGGRVLEVPEFVMLPESACPPHSHLHNRLLEVVSVRR